jgi:uncharacterized protein YecA (UPF0149 family)
MVRGLFYAGLSKQEIRKFFRLVDGVLKLSPEQEDRFEQELEQMEKETGMPYITSLERKGLEKGRAEGLRLAITGVLETRFGEISTNTREQLEVISAQDKLQALSLLAATAESLEAFQSEL